MKVVLRLNDVKIRQRLASEGFILCKCSEYDGDSLFFNPEGYFEIHSNYFVNLDTADIKDFNNDIEGFISYCKELKKDKVE